MAKDKNKRNKNESDEPVVPAETGAEAAASAPGAAAGDDQSENGSTASVNPDEDLVAAEGPDVETSSDAEAPADAEEVANDPTATGAAGDAGSEGASADGIAADGAEAPEVVNLTEEEVRFIEEGEKDLVAEMRNDMLRAQAELVNFRTRVERDRVANREAVIAEVIRSLLPAIDDLARAETHGDLAGSPLELVAQKIRGGFEKYGLRSVGVKGEPFDPHFHEALVQVPSADVKVNTIADVIETGYALNDRLIRAAKVAVLVPQD
jgi:molecular chaperone GrpE